MRVSGLKGQVANSWWVIIFLVFLSLRKMNVPNNVRVFWKVVYIELSLSVSVLFIVYKLLVLVICLSTNFRIFTGSVKSVPVGFVWNVSYHRTMFNLVGIHMLLKKSSMGCIMPFDCLDLSNYNSFLICSLTSPTCMGTSRFFIENLEFSGIPWSLPSDLKRHSIPISQGSNLSTLLEASMPYKLL